MSRPSSSTSDPSVLIDQVRSNSEHSANAFKLHFRRGATLILGRQINDQARLTAAVELALDETINQIKADPIVVSGSDIARLLQQRIAAVREAENPVTTAAAAAVELNTLSKRHRDALYRLYCTNEPEGSIAKRISMPVEGLRSYTADLRRRITARVSQWAAASQDVEAA